MPLVAHRTLVDASSDLLWSMMLEKIEHPERYVPGVVSSEILDRPGPSVVERAMQLDAPGGPKIIRETISWSAATRSVIFKLKDDPVYRGYVINAIFETDDGCVLDYTMHWTPLADTPAGAAEPDWQETIRNAVEHAKAEAERRSKAN